MDGADEAFLCVAFVHSRGLHLLEKELDGLRRRETQARLLVTTTFQEDGSALSLAGNLGLDVRVLNPGGGKTFHPKIYLGSRGDAVQAVIGSANLTGGLATNLEAAVLLGGTRADEPIARAWAWAEELWSDPRAQPWTPRAGEPVEEPFEPGLYKTLRAEVKRDPVFRTLSQGRPNRVAELTPVEVLVETERSTSRTGGAEPIPAWMFNLAWDRLRAFGELTNRQLLDDLRVHRSSAVCAMLARVPGVERMPGREIGLRWNQRR
jgi:hypothetical protein